MVFRAGDHLARGNISTLSATKSIINLQSSKKHSIYEGGYLCLNLNKNEKKHAIHNSRFTLY